MCNEQGKVVLVSIDQMLLNIYNKYIHTVQIYLHDQINKLEKGIQELKLIERMKPLISIELKSNPNDVTKVINNIAVVIKIDIELIKQIFEKYNLNRIFKLKTDTLKLENEKKRFNDKLNNLIKYVWVDKYFPLVKQ